MSRGIEAKGASPHHDPLPPEASERRLNRVFQAHQDIRYQGFAVIGGKVYRKIDLGLATWPEGDKLHGKSVHSPRGGNKPGRR